MFRSHSAMSLGITLKDIEAEAVLPVDVLNDLPADGPESSTTRPEVPVGE